MTTTPQHGTITGYFSQGCRCSECKGAATAYQAERRAERRRVDPPEHVHGTTNGYVNYYCRCTDCTEAQKVTIRDYRAARS